MVIQNYISIEFFWIKAFNHSAVQCNTD